jgi:hypothetical protein
MKQGKISTHEVDPDENSYKTLNTELQGLPLHRFVSKHLLTFSYIRTIKRCTDAMLDTKNRCFTKKYIMSINRFYTRILAAILITGFVALISCSSEEEIPSNVIKDDAGIKIDLDWSTGGTINDALADADLDLIIYKNNVEVLSSKNVASFERIEFDPNLYADGTYVMAIYLYSNDEDVSYTATVNGINVSKPYTFSSTFATEDDNLEVKALNIVKSGNSYTVTDIN